jgi:hypothetical protein
MRLLTKPLALAIALMVFLGAGPELSAQEYSSRELFQHFRQAIVQVRITNTLSGEKTAIGSGFYVSAKGHILTNYHVISFLVHKPEDYSIEVIHLDGQTEKAELQNLDVLHDLAIIKTGRTPGIHLRLSDRPLQKGSRIASMGNPHDLGLTVVGGLYNGIIKDSLAERIHFTGAINPGMSGGPALDSRGRVIGINVATAGNEISFLVPARYAIRLLDTTLAHPSGVQDFYAVMGEQLLKHQARMYASLQKKKLKTNPLGNYRVPGKLFPYLKCWGDSDKDDKGYYEIVTKICSTNDNIYIDHNYKTGTVYYRHKIISSDKLNAIRFAHLYENNFRNTPFAGGVEKYVGNYKCRSSFVDINHITMKAGMCLRPNKKFAGLYDLVLKAATLEDNTSGLQTDLVATGISYDNARLLTKQYLQAISWEK